MKKKLPKNLNLFTIRFPLPAIASILHRISGVLLFFFIPLMLWGLSSSLSSGQSFEALHEMLSKPTMKFIIFCFLSAFIYHFLAGIRHLLMDMGIGEELKSGKCSALLILMLSAIFIILTGIWLW